MMTFDVGRRRRGPVPPCGRTAARVESEAARAGRVHVRQALGSPQSQPKLTVGPPDGGYPLPDPPHHKRVQRVCADCEEELQRAPAEEPEKEALQCQRAGASGEPLVGPEVELGIRSLRGQGQPLSGSTRGFFETRLSADLSGVRVHTDAHAAAMAREVDARAFTLGSDVVFGAGAYAPDTSEGRRLLAHELTHVVQQDAAPAADERLDRQPAGPDAAPAPAAAPVPITFDVASTDLTPKDWGDRNDVNSGGANTRTNMVIGGPPNSTIDITHVRDDTQDYGHTHTNEPAGAMGRRFKHGHLTNRGDGQGGQYHDFQIDAAGANRTITYHAPHAAGEVVLEARIRGRGDAAAQTSARVTAEVTGLQEYTTTHPNETLIGQDAEHGTNHWCTAATAAEMLRIVTEFRDAWAAAEPDRDPDDAPTIRINDMSLEHGGVYDFNDNWTNPHRTHRFGEDIDISRRVLVEGVSTYLQPGAATGALYNLLNTAVGVAPEDANHWHVDV